MTDSVERSAEENTNEKILERLAHLDVVPANEKENVEDLPRWVKTAFIMKDLDGLTYKEIAKRFNRSPKTIKNYASSPAAKEFRSLVQDWADDPINVAEAYLKGNALSVSLDRIAFLEMAIQAGDYKEGDRIARDLQDRIGLTKKASKGDVAPSITIQLPEGTTAQAIEADYEVLDEESVEADYEVLTEGGGEE